MVIKNPQRIKKKEVIEKKQSKKQLKTYYIPVILMSIYLMTIIIGIVQHNYIMLTESNIDSKNYQQIIEVADTDIAFKYTYIKEDELVIIPWIKYTELDMTTLNINSIYYKIYEDEELILAEGYLNNTPIKIPLEEYQKQNIYIDLYGIKSIEEVAITDPIEVIINKNVVDQWVDIIDFITNENTTVDSELAIKFIDDNYINKHLYKENKYPNSMKDFIDTYLRSGKKDKANLLKSTYQELKKTWEIQKNIMMGAGVTENEIKAYMQIKNPYDDYFSLNELILNYKNLQVFADQKAANRVIELEEDLEKNNINLSAYYENKNALSPYEQIKQLEDLKQ